MKEDLEKEDSYDDMHGLSHPSQHANDEADRSNNVVIYKDLEISTLRFLKHEWKIWNLVTRKPDHIAWAVISQHFYKLKKFLSWKTEYLDIFTVFF